MPHVFKTGDEFYISVVELKEDYLRVRVLVGQEDDEPLYLTGLERFGSARQFEEDALLVVSPRDAAELAALVLLNRRGW